jgi:hypothetical protein
MKSTLKRTINNHIINWQHGIVVASSKQAALFQTHHSLSFDELFYLL